MYVRTLLQTLLSHTPRLRCWETSAAAVGLISAIVWWVEDGAWEQGLKSQRSTEQTPWKLVCC